MAPLKRLFRSTLARAPAPPDEAPKEVQISDRDNVLMQSTPDERLSTSPDRFTEAALAGRSWSFERSNGEVIAKNLRLLPGGRMSGFRHENEYRWSLEAGQIAFFNTSSEKTTVFSDIEETSTGRYVLKGDFLLKWDAPAVHVLREIEPIGVSPPEDGERVPLEGRASGFRRNLVILRANEKSLHNEWTRNISDDDRSWDLCVSWYGDESNLPAREGFEYVAHQAEYRKFSAIHQLLFKGSPLWNYDYIMLPDDDLMLSWRDINQSFELCREFRLELAQPSLRHGSYWGLEFVLQQPETLLRYTNFVESMMPIFSRDALEICATTFPQSTIGWGLDVLWPVLLGSRRSNVAIFDAVSVLHTRPVGASYNGTEADASGASVIQRYGVVPEITEFGRLKL